MNELRLFLNTLCNRNQLQMMMMMMMMMMIIIIMLRYSIFRTGQN